MYSVHIGQLPKCTILGESLRICGEYTGHIQPAHNALQAITKIEEQPPVSLKASEVRWPP